MRRALLLALGLLLLLPGLLLTWGLSSAGAARTAVQLLDAHTPLQLEYGGGSLRSGIALKRLVVSTDDATVSLEDAGARLALSCLWRSEICLRALEVRALDVKVHAVEGGDEETPWWPLPFSVSSPAVRISALRVSWDGGELRSGDIEGSARVFGDTVHIGSATASGTRLNIPDPGTQGAPDEPLPDVDLPLTLLVDRLQLTDSQWSIRGARNDYDFLEFGGTWAGHVLEILNGVLANNQWGEARVAGSMTFIHPYALEARGRFAIDSPPLWAGLHQGRGELQLAGDLRDLRIDGHLCSTVGARFTGSVDTLGIDLPLSMRLTDHPCEDSQPRIALADLAPSAQADITLSAPWSVDIQGDLERQHLDFDGVVSGMGYTEVSVAADGELRGNDLQLDRLRLEEGAGALEARGDLHLGEDPGWDLQLQASELDLRPVQAQLPERVSGTLDLAGRSTASGWQMALSAIDLRGLVGGYPFSGTGDMQLDQDLDFGGSRAELDVNGARLSFSQAVGGSPRGQLRVDDLGNWVGQRGELDLEWEWRRSRGQLAVRGYLRDLAAAPLQAKSAQLSGKLDYSTGEPRLSLGLTAPGARLGEQSLDSLAVRLQGAPSRHRFTLEASGDVGMNLFVDGSLQEGDWRGVVQPASLGLAEDAWTTGHTVALDYREEDGVFAVEDHCWRQSGASLCVSGALLGTNGSASIELDVALATLVEMMPARFTSTGRALGRIKATWQAMEMQALAAELDVGPGRLEEVSLGGQRASLGWDLLTIRYEGTRAGGALRGRLRRDETDQLQIALNMPTDPAGPLSGTVKLSGIELAPLRPFVARLSRLEGFLEGDLVLDGTVGAPQINGSLALRDGLLSIAGNPTEVSDVRLGVDFLGDRAALAGSLLAGGGSSELHGELNWLGEPSLRLSMAGEEKRLLYPPDSHVLASENLVLELSTTRTALTGDIQIRRGHFVLEALPESAVEISDDVVVLDPSGEPVAASSPTPIEVDLRVSIADGLRVTADLMDGTLGGDLQLYRPARQPVRVLGSINVVQGRVELLGPPFDITRGQLTFVGAPDNPQLDVAMEREITQEQVTVGVRVSGTLSRPELAFYSRPALPEAEVMAYALGGRGIDRAGGGEGLALALAATSGYLNSAGILRGVSLGVEGKDAKTRAVIAGQLSERIYLSYGVGLYEPVNTLSVRLDLLRNLWMEVVSSLQSSADLYYSWSR